MPNGRNAGRLFADCENEHGYGASHSLVDENGWPFDLTQPRTEPVPVTCRHCHRHFTLAPNGDLIPEGEPT